MIHRESVRRQTILQTHFQKARRILISILIHLNSEKNVRETCEKMKRIIFHQANVQKKWIILGFISIKTHIDCYLNIQAKQCPKLCCFILKFNLLGLDKYSYRFQNIIFNKNSNCFIHKIILVYWNKTKSSVLKQFWFAFIKIKHCQFIVMFEFFYILSSTVYDWHASWNVLCQFHFSHSTSVISQM